MAAPPFWKKTQKSRYYSCGLTDVRKIWHNYAKWVSRPPGPLKIYISKIQNRGWSQYPPDKSQMADGLHFPKTVKSPHIRNRLTAFDEIWHSDADWPPPGDRRLKFWIFQKPRWRRPPSWKSQKSRYPLNSLTDLYEIWHDYAKWVSYPPRPLKNLNFKMADGRYFKNR